MVTHKTHIDSNVVKRFAVLLEKQRLAHAYLFIGPKDVGKSETTLGVAKLVNCEQPLDGLFCGECPSCRKIDSGNHPDIHIFEKKQDEETIKIEQIRQLTEKTHLRAFEAKIKVCIIKNIEDMTLEGANALLKTLEEPAANSLLLLTTSNPEKNLDTIRSRCHHIFFFPWTNQRLAQQLAKDYAIDASQSHFLACFSEGCLGRARRWNEADLFRRKNQTIDRIVLSLDSEEYIKEILADRNQTREALNILLTWFRDLLLLKNGVENRSLVHLDRINDLRKVEARYSFVDIEIIISEIVSASKLLEENLNIKVALTLLKEKLWRKSSKSS